MRVIPPEFKQRENNSQCPVCSKPKTEWKRTISYRCCSKECTSTYWSSAGIEFDWKKIRGECLSRDNYTCAYCNKKKPSSELIGDHIIPIALGGLEFDHENVQCLCENCHKKKTKVDIEMITNYKRIEKKLIDGQKQMGDYNVRI